jgi:16S rRNA (guanine527-N7)-methyltransferase
MSAETELVNEFRSAIRKGSRRYGIALDQDVLDRFADYYRLLLVWNPRLHLVAPCSPSEFARRHVLESLMLLPHLPPSARVADIGSGAGLPIIPNLSARPDVRAVLIESSQKKAVFLSEALHAIGASEHARVIARRFEDVPQPDVDTVTCRALDRFPQMLIKLVDWSPRLSSLLLFGGETIGKEIERAHLTFSSFKIPDSERRWLFVVKRESPGAATD